MLLLFFIMHRLSGTVQWCTNEDDEQLPIIFVVGGVRTSESYPSAHTDIHNEILVHSEYSINQLVCHDMDKKYLICLQLDHDRDLRGFLCQSERYKGFYVLK